jgi:hypothetical protein
LPLIFAVPAAAQATRTWISGVGDDANPCSRTAPCKTFPGALSKTAAGGEIDVLDPGGFGAVTITKAITLAAEGSGEGGILVQGTNGINISAGVNDHVILRGLQLDGGPLGSNSGAGVKFNSGAALSIQNCSIRNFTGTAVGTGYGVYFAPNASSTLFISDSTITNNGQPSSTSGGGVLIQPSGSGMVKAHLVRVNLIDNNLGVRADGSTSTGEINVSIADSLVAGSTYAGFTAFTAMNQASVAMEIMRSTSANNATGVNSHGTGATMRIGYSSITGNTTGVVITGAMTSLGNNLIYDNANPGATIQLAGPM